ncbi:MAG: N-acetylglucosamine-6-phosphate deacetylase [Thermoguttaceae bacterium]|jgi:N-acetylglucosamine-6-phosphate deacetylase
MTQTMRSYRGRRYDTLEFVTVEVTDDKIVSVEAAPPDTKTSTPWIAPGLFDIQVNGAVGHELSSATLTKEGVIEVLQKMLRDGVFRCCLTLTTNAPATMIQSSKTIADALEERPEYRSIVWGIHLEGPFISTAEGAAGAHPKQYCVPYSEELIRKIQEAARGLVKLVTLSPEYPNVGDFTRFLRNEGIVVAIGHTNADGSQLDEAVGAGATLSTHLSNATQYLLPKWENYFFGQLADDRLCASVIADGFHISPQLLRAIVRTKGLERLILISDQSPLAGFPPGKYSTELCDLEIQPNGKVTLAGDPNLLACASFPVSNGVANVATIEDLPLASVYPLATTSPARLLNAPKFSSGDGDFLQPGGLADFLLFDVVPATLGERGLYDGSSFRTGRFEFQKIVWRGKEISPKREA